MFAVLGPLEPLKIENSHLQGLVFSCFLLLRRETLTGAGGYCLALKLRIKLEYHPGPIQTCTVHACTRASRQHLGPHPVIDKMTNVVATQLVSVYLILSTPVMEKEVKLLQRKPYF